MTSKNDVEKFLKELQVRIKIFGILFLDRRGKNQQALLDLEITPNKRKDIIKSIEVRDYSQGPIEEEMRSFKPMWVFGKTVKSKEVYIKISLGKSSSKAVCISFHIAEHSLKYPFK